MSALRWKGSRESLRRAIRDIPAILAGTAPDPFGVHGLFWGIVGNGVLTLIKTDFLTKLAGGRGVDGVQWAQLAVATLAKRRRAGREDSDILRETGQLLASLESGSGELPLGSSPDQIFTIRRDGVEVGTADRTATFHQEGVPGRMPARPIVPTGAFTRGWEDELERICGDAMVHVIERVCQAGD